MPRNKIVTALREIENAATSRIYGINRRLDRQYNCGTCGISASGKILVQNIKDSIQHRKIIIHLTKSRAERITSAIVRRRTDVNGLKGHADLGVIEVQITNRATRLLPGRA